MSFYWDSKDLRSPPPGTQLTLFPFDSKEKISFSHRVMTLPTPQMIASVSSVEEIPNRSDWNRLVRAALDEIRKGQFQKVVLARKTILRCSERIDPWEIVSRLKERNEGATLFCVASEKEAFLGATPERLFAREGERLFVEAMAGTKKKGEMVLRLEKQRREFDWVEQYFQEQLSGCSLVFSPVTTHSTHNLIHLFSQGEGVWPKSVQEEGLIHQLAPTPALGGTPRLEATEWLKQNEPFQRGYYGGVIGWSTSERSDWMVAIRSCAIREKEAHLYVGAGIVEGSDPDEEWEELNAKLALYRGVFQWPS